MSTLESGKSVEALPGLVLGIGPDGRCDDFRLGGATVVFDETTGIWRMWYYCRDRVFAGPSTLGTGRIAMAVSNDGMRWQRHDGPCELGSVFEPSAGREAFDSLHVGISDITYGPDGLEMWYFAGSHHMRHSARLGDVAGLGMLPGLATSGDGLNWTRQPGKGLAGALLALPEERLYRSWPNAFRHGGALYMHTTEAHSDLSQFATTVWRQAPHGVWEGLGELQWTDDSPGYDEAGMVTRQVLPNPLPEGGPLLMIYTGVDHMHRRSIAAAHSQDGQRWERLYREPIFRTGGDGAWDRLGVAANRLVHAHGQLYLYYYGFQTLGDDAGMRGIGLAVGPDSDLRALRRVSLD